MPRIIRISGSWLAAPVLLWLLVAVTVPAAAQTPGKAVEISIPAGSLASALEQLGNQSGVQIMYRPELVDGISVAAINGVLTVDDALTQLLSHTGLVAYRVNDKTVVLKRIASKTQPPANKGPDQPAAPRDTEGDSVALQEVVVSAQKREERLQDVPIPVTALNGAQLTESNHTLLRDYFDTVPGFSVSPGPSAGGQQMLVIRGISSGAFGNPTVGITVDDVPFGAFTREYAPDIDPNDLQRIEVLRGPQGTLYGASSMGGLVKFVTVDPSTERAFGRVEVGTSGIRNGQSVGYNVRGAVNVPLTAKLAVRASAFTRRDPGYIDNPVLGLKGVNEDRANGGRLSALWRPAVDTSVKLSGLYQITTGDGLSEVDRAPGLGDLQQNYIRGVGNYRRTLEAVSAVATTRLGKVELTSVTGYSAYRYRTSNDYSFFLTPLAEKYFGVSGGPMFAFGNQEKFSQEIRASIPLGDRVEWLLGGFYTHENTPLIEYEDAANTADGQVVGTLFSYDIPIKYDEYAAFTDLTFHLTERFEVQVGARESFLNEDFKAVREGGAELVKPVVLPEIKSTPNVTTYLVTPQYRLSRDFMVYARVASGYRPSRSNSFNPDPLVPTTAKPDTTQNYEIGTKGSFLNDALSVDASVYYINWRDIQISLMDLSNHSSYYTNGSGAKSEGVELTLEAHPLPGLTVSTWVTYDDAVLTKAFPPATSAYGPAGSRLPYTSRVSGSFSLSQDFPIVGETDGFAGAAVSYMGDRLGTFIATPQRAYYPAYAKVDLKAGIRMKSWELDAYANNVTDRRGVIGGGAGNYPPDAFVVIQPRTVGVGVVRNF